MAAEAVPPWKRPRSNFEIVRFVQKVTAAAFAKGYGASRGEAVTPWSKSPTSMVWFMVKLP